MQFTVVVREIVFWIAGACVYNVVDVRGHMKPGMAATERVIKCMWTWMSSYW